MATFIGRKNELKLLNDLLRKDSASLVVIKGRRRIGKSRLCQEFGAPFRTYLFSGLPPEEKLTAQMQREDFSAQLHRQLGIPPVRADDWGDLFWHLADRTKSGRVVIILDEISWMGSKDPTFLGKLKTAWDTQFKRNSKLILILSGSIASWIEEKILSHTGFMGRISLNLTIEELSLSECSEFWKSQIDHVSAYEKLKFLSVTGGVPRYLEELLPKESADENIRRLCFQKEGLLFLEFEQIFSDLFERRAGIYKQIVESLAYGHLGMDEIFSALKIKKTGTMSRYLEDLVLAGLVTRDYSWDIKSKKESKLSHYRLSDNYLRFYLRYIDPNRSKILRGVNFNLPAWDTVMGLQFENLVLKNRHTIKKQLNINERDVVYDNPFFQTKTKTQSGCQIDYLIQEKYNTLYLCEIKFSTKSIEIEVIDQIKEKIRKLHRPKGFSIRPVLIHVNGVSESVLETEYFTHVIDFGRFFQN